jgi:hypothetical protein
MEVKLCGGSMTSYVLRAKRLPENEKLTSGPKGRIIQVCYVRAEQVAEKRSYFPQPVKAVRFAGEFSPKL